MNFPCCISLQRGRRGGGIGGRRPAATPARRPAAPAPAPQQQTRSSGGGMLSGIGSTIAQGMAFGTGSSIAHHAVGAAVNSMSGGGNAEHQAAPVQQQQQGFDAAQGGVCANDKQLFFDCLKANSGDAQSCSFLYEKLQQCQNQSSQATFY